MKRDSFFYKFLRYIGLPLFLCVLLLLVLTFVLANQRKLELKNLETQSQLQATLFAEKITGKLNTLEILLESLAKQSVLMDLSKESGEELLERTIRQDQLIFSDIEGVCILNPQGEKLYSSFTHESDTLDIMRANLTKLHIEQQLPFSSLAFTDQGEQYLTLSRSIEDTSGKIARIVTLIVRTNLFHEQLKLTSIPGIEQFILSDAEDAIVAFWTSDTNFEATPQTFEDVYPAHAEEMPADLQTTLQAGIRSYTSKGKFFTIVSLSGFPYTLTLKGDILMAMRSYDKALTISFSFLIMIVLISVVSITRLGFEVTKKEAEQAELLDSLAHKVQQRTLALKNISEQDALTGLPNRRKINSLLTQEIEQCKSDGCIFSLLILDIDHFKLVNDTFGHQKGDDIILEIVGQLSPIVAGEGTLARWGGDELMVLLPDYTLVQAIDIANMMRMTIEAGTFTHNLNLR